jgi:hypothetical protein
MDKSYIIKDVVTDRERKLIRIERKCALENGGM